MAITGQQAFNALLAYKKDLSDVPTDTFLGWVNYANRFFYRHVIAVDPERFISETTLTLQSGVATYNLPSDFRDVQVFGCGFFEIDSNGVVTDTEYALTNRGYRIIGQFISGSQVRFTPAPTKTLQVLLRYIPNIVDLADLSDETYIPDEYMLYLRDALDVLYTQWDEEPGSESFADQRYVRALDEMSRTIKRQPANYGIDNFSAFF